MKQILEEESEALKTAEEVQELDKMKKKMIDHVQYEIKEHNHALQQFMEIKDGGGMKGGGGKSNKRRQKKRNN